MENIRDSLVTRELKAALNEVLSDYNPLEQIQEDSESAKPDLNAFARDVQTGLSRRVGNDIEIESVILPIIRFDTQTQSKINAYQAEVANTRIAEQREQTAQAQARANRNLAGSISKTRTCWWPSAWMSSPRWSRRPEGPDRLLVLAARIAHLSGRAVHSERVSVRP